jgi:hypothetical protein
MKQKIDSVSKWLVVILVLVVVVRANGPGGLSILLDLKKSDTEVSEHFKAICAALEFGVGSPEDGENGLECIRRGIFGTKFLALDGKEALSTPQEST